MPALASKKSLSASQQKLVETFQRLNFGRIEGLLIRGGEPVLDPPPKLIQGIKIGAENGPRPELEKKDFLLKASYVELFQHFQRIDDGVITVLEFKHGVPFMFEFER